jgi:hypothetical protein
MGYITRVYLYGTTGQATGLGTIVDQVLVDPGIITDQVLAGPGITAAQVLAHGVIAAAGGKVIVKIIIFGA